MKTLSAVLTSMIIFSTSACGPGTTTGNPQVTLSFEPYSEQSFMKWLLPSAYAATSQLKFCFKRLRFKVDGAATAGDKTKDNDNIDLSLGEVDISPSGTDLTTVEIPANTYRRIEFDLDK